MSKETTLIGQATPEQIKDWKEKNKSVYALTAGGHIGYIRNPNRKDLSFATTGSGGGKEPIKFNEILLKNCWLGGSDAIQTDDSLFLAVSGKLSEIIEVAESTLEKL